MDAEMLDLVMGVPLVYGLVALAKQFGLTTRWAMLLSVVLGVGICLADVAFAGFVWYQAVDEGLTVGLCAAGLYDVSKAARVRLPPGVPVTPPGCDATVTGGQQ